MLSGDFAGNKEVKMLLYTVVGSRVKYVCIMLMSANVQSRGGELATEELKGDIRRKARQN